MAEDHLSGLVDSVRASLQAELEAQLKVVATHQAQAIAEAQRKGEADADARWSALLEKSRTEGQQQLRAAVTAARADVEQRVAAEVTKVRIDRDRQLAEETRRLRAELGRSSQKTQSALLPAFREIDTTTSVSAALGAILSAARAAVPRAALFISNGPELDEWEAGVSAATSRITSENKSGVELALRALGGAATVREEHSVAIPLLIDGRPIGVLAGHDQDENEGSRVELRVETLELIARHGATHLAYLTALRTAQARQWIGRESLPSVPPGLEEAVQSARRYARLLVSEIKLYNEAAVREARGDGDLRRRLGPEIDRARRMYEERVPSTVPHRSQYFHQELVQTLARGDASLLG
jgi:hypothetical protein